MPIVDDDVGQTRGRFTAKATLRGQTRVHNRPASPTTRQEWVLRLEKARDNDTPPNMIWCSVLPLREVFLDMFSLFVSLPLVSLFSNPRTFKERNKCTDVLFVILHDDGTLQLADVCATNFSVGPTAVPRLMSIFFSLLAEAEEHRSISMIKVCVTAFVVSCVGNSRWLPDPYGKGLKKRYLGRNPITFRLRIFVVTGDLHTTFSTSPFILPPVLDRSLLLCPIIKTT